MTDASHENRKLVLKLAKNAVLADRNKDYGAPEDNFFDIAMLWTAYKGVEFTRADVAMMSVLIKVARSITSPTKADHYVDIAGYAACALPSALADQEDVEAEAAYGGEEGVLAALVDEIVQTGAPAGKNGAG